jgi:RNA polymerase sigma factor (sigma-70 family)
MNVDKRLIEECCQNKRRAQQALYEACFPYFISICRRYSRDDQEAMSLLNIGFYKILTGLPKWKDHIPFKTWSKRVLINALIDEYRKNKVYKESTLQAEQIEPYVGQKHSDQNDSDKVWAEEELLRWTRTLPAMTAQVFNMYAVEGFPYEEIAKSLNVTESTVRWHVFEARKKLKVLIEMTIKVER